MKDIADRTGRGGKEDERKVLEEEAHRDRRNQNRKAGRATQRLIGDLFGQKADQRADHDRKQYAKPRRKPRTGEQRDRKYRHISAYHDEISVCKVN